MTPSTYHLTPRSLVGRRFAPDSFGAIRVALVGYCPPPPAFGRYARERVRDQRFIHVSPDSVRIVRHADIEVLSLAHVYGGPVSSATVEELAYYGIDHVLAYGLAGGLGVGSLGVGDLSMGSTYVVASALVADGTTPHYAAAPMVAADAGLLRQTQELWAALRPEPLHPVHAATGDAIYREDDGMLDGFRARGCHVVNLDSAHLYAVAAVNSEGRRLRAVQCGVVSDVVHPDGRSESTLAAMLQAGATSPNPLARTGEVVRFFVEELAPRLQPS